METKDNNEIYQAAKKLVEEGCSVVPIKLGKKAPSIKWEIYQRRLPTADELSEWFVGTNNQLGLITGSISNGKFIVDFDGIDWGVMFEEFMNRFHELLKSRVVRTGSGKPHIHGKSPA